jgi:O-antigen/teichoic acid export membrane protein
MYEDTIPSVTSPLLASLGRGTFFLLSSRISMIVASYLIHLILGRTLGPARYGTVGTVLAILTAQRTIVGNVTNQVVSKYLAETLYPIDKVRLWSLIVQSIATWSIALAYYLLADPFARLINDPVLGLCLRASTLFVPLAGWYAVQTSTLNGLRLFAKQGVTIIVYNFFRVTLVLGNLYLFTSAPIQEVGVMLGLTLSPLIAGTVAQAFYARHYNHSIKRRKIKRTSIINRKQIALFVLHVLSSALGITILLNSGQLIVKILSSDPAQAGYYTAASTFGLAAHAVLLAFADVIVPISVHTRQMNGITAASTMITRTGEYMLWIMFLILALLGASASALVTWVYRSEFLPAAQLIPWSCTAFSLLSIYILLSNSIATTFSSRIVAVTSIGVVLGTIILGITGVRLGQARGFLFAITVVLSVALIVYRVYLQKLEGHLSIYTLRWPVICAFLVALTTWLLHPQKEMLLLTYITLSTVYFLALWFTGTINQEEKQVVLHYGRNALRLVRLGLESMRRCSK